MCHRSKAAPHLCLMSQAPCTSSVTLGWCPLHSEWASQPLSLSSCCWSGDKQQSCVALACARGATPRKTRSPPPLPLQLGRQVMACGRACSRSGEREFQAAVRTCLPGVDGFVWVTRDSRPLDSSTAWATARRRPGSRQLWPTVFRSPRFPSLRKQWRGSPRGLVTGGLLRGHPDTRPSRGPASGALGLHRVGPQPGRRAPRSQHLLARESRGGIAPRRPAWCGLGTRFSLSFCVQHPGVITTCGEVSPLSRWSPWNCFNQALWPCLPLITQRHMWERICRSLRPLVSRRGVWNPSQTGHPVSV